MPDLRTKWEAKVFLAVFLIGLSYALCTGHIWEDALIAFRGARNLATGHGLTYNVAERVQAFSSPIGVLLPAALVWVTRNGSETPVLWVYRLMTLAAWGAGVVLLCQILKKYQRSAFAMLFTVALLVMDPKTVDFATNGMETGILLFFLALTLHGLLLAGPGRMWRIGLGWAGMMWTRPDSFVYIAALGIGALLFLRDEGAPSPGGWWKILLPAGVVCTVLYLPWFLWAWSYYGSPVPNTIVAKALGNSPLDPVDLVTGFVLFPFAKLLATSPLWWTFMPTYCENGWPWFQQSVCLILSWTAALAWLCPLLRPQTRVLSFGYYVSQFYLCDVVQTTFPWYFPAAAVLGYLVIGLMFDQVLALALRLSELGWARGWFRYLGPVACAIAAALMLGQAGVLVNVTRQMQVQQITIEDGLRKQVGLWLRDHARSPDDTLMLEPLGYIGYYSQLRTFDWPGLSSRQVVEVRRRLGPGSDRDTYLELKPDWLVLRPDEARGRSYINPKHLDELYQQVAVFDVSDKIQAIHWLPDRGTLAFDAKFLVFHRRPATTSPAKSDAAP